MLEAGQRLSREEEGQTSRLMGGKVLRRSKLISCTSNPKRSGDGGTGKRNRDKDDNRGV